MTLSPLVFLANGNFRRNFDWIIERLVCQFLPLVAGFEPSDMESLVGCSTICLNAGLPLKFLNASTNF
jgi:hypothetical protein